MDCTRHLMAPIWFVPNISHSDTERPGVLHQYFMGMISSTKRVKRGLANYLPWIRAVLEFPALEHVTKTHTSTESSKIT